MTDKSQRHSFSTIGQIWWWSLVTSQMRTENDTKQSENGRSSLAGKSFRMEKDENNWKKSNGENKITNKSSSSQSCKSWWTSQISEEGVIKRKDGECAHTNQIKVAPRFVRSTKLFVTAFEWNVSPSWSSSTGGTVCKGRTGRENEGYMTCKHHPLVGNSTNHTSEMEKASTKAQMNIKPKRITHKTLILWLIAIFVQTA